MARDLYSSCPCGSGKKFKWCCQPIHTDIDRAFGQDAEGQHDTALRLMDELAAKHADNPEAWGRRAQLLYQNQKLEEAEASLQKAFDLNPSYAFGSFLRGVFRQNEGESTGALLLFRKAADLYDPGAGEPLAQVYIFISQNEMKLNRPVAARAALELAARLAPGEESIRRDFEVLFGETSQLPEAARRAYVFASPSAERRGTWDKFLNANIGGQLPIKLSEAAAAFQTLTTNDPADAAAWYNLGLVRAWLGDNQAALDAVEHFAGLEEDEAKAVDALTLAAVLRCASGMEDRADVVEHAFLYQLNDPRPVLAAWDQQQRLFGVQANQESGFLIGCVLEKSANFTPELAALKPPRLGAFFLMSGGVLRIWHTVESLLKAVRDELNQQYGQLLRLVETQRGPVQFRDVLAETLVFPVGIASQEEAEQRIVANQTAFFEETWVRRQLPSLNGATPLDAAAQPSSWRKVLAAVRFIEECSAIAGTPYDFNRLRRALGVSATGATTSGSAATPPISALSSAELAAAPVDSLSDEQLELGFQTALQHGDRDLAGRFAAVLIARPPSAERPDRYPWYTHLVQVALNEGNTTRALDLLNEGEAADCTHNEGKRRNDYELRRGQIMTKSGDPAAAQDVFDRLLARVPSELRFYVGAAEAMLSQKQGSRALAFAEAGLNQARVKNDRDSEEHFKELAAAARKQGG